MKPLEHTSALVWLAVLLGLAAAVCAGISATIDTTRYSYLTGTAIDEGALALKIGLGAFADLAAIAAIASTVGAVVLHGVKQMLSQMRLESGGSGEGSAAQSAVGDSGVDLGGRDGGVPEEPLHRE